MKPFVRLLDRRLRVVEFQGPKSSAARRPTDRVLLFAPYGLDPARKVGICFMADDESARFLIDDSPLGDKFLEVLDKASKYPAEPYGATGWRVKE